MAANLDDSLKSAQSQEFAQLKRKSRSGLMLPLALIGGVIMLLFIGSSLLKSYRLESGGLSSARAQLELRNYEWSNRLLEEHSDYRDWLSRRGTTSELIALDNISHAIFQTALSFSHDEARDPGFLTRIYISLTSATLRISFIILAAWRLCLFAVICAVCFGALTLPYHSTQDVLGVAGNGRLFYSGIRAGLDELTPNGAPANQFPGLACPMMVSESDAASSELFRIVQHYGAMTDTNRTLIRIILAYPEWPGFTGELGNEEELFRNFQGATLSDLTRVVLETTLEIHARYSQSESAGAPVTTVPETEFRTEGERLTLGEYQVILPSTLDRVLTPAMRRKMSTIRPELLATVILAQQAGKVLAFAFEAGKWVKRSRFPLLSARSVLHSVSHYAKEFNFDERNTIRRAVIYGSRISVFGPVRMPVDLADDVRAIRQWVEVLDSNPHLIQSRADDVELYGIVTTLRAMWDGALKKIMKDPDSAFRQKSMATQTGLLFVPTAELVRVFKSIVRSEILLRLEELCARVSKRQRVVEYTGGDEEIEIDEVVDRIPSSERIFEPFGESERDRLGKEHEVSETTIRVWSSIRAVLNSGSWLARRVGDYSVPESSLIFAIFEGVGVPDGNESGERLGMKGVVPLRGNHFEERFGKNWFSLFRAAQSAKMSHSISDYKDQLEGRKSESDDGVFGSSSVA